MSGELGRAPRSAIDSDGWVTHLPHRNRILMHGRVEPGHAQVVVRKLLTAEVLCGDIENEQHSLVNDPEFAPVEAWFRCPNCKAQV